jgi:hypothetical protein
MQEMGSEGIETYLAQNFMDDICDRIGGGFDPEVLNWRKQYWIYYDRGSSDLYPRRVMERCRAQ